MNKIYNNYYVITKIDEKFVLEYVNWAFLQCHLKKDKVSKNASTST